MEGIAASLITNGVLIGGSDVFFSDFLIFLSFFKCCLRFVWSWLSKSASVIAYGCRGFTSSGN